MSEEIKVWVDGKERVIRGVSEETTCESVILVLAKAAEKSGKLALLEKWRDCERILPPDANPTKLIQAWGAYKNEVSLLLQYEEGTSTNQQNNTLINLIADDKLDVIKDSIDCESLENLTSFQQRKLQRLVRAIEIFDLQFNCWDNSEEAFLYLTEEEIIEDLSVKLSCALKLQAKELVEFETWKTELNKLQQNHEKLISKRVSTGEKIANHEAQIAESCSTMEELMEEVKKTRNEEELMVENSRSSALTREELHIATRELDKQSILFQKQEQNLDAIMSSLSELDTSLRRKSIEIEQLRNEIENDSEIYDLSDDFRPQIPEVESKLTFPEINHDIGLSGNFDPHRPSFGSYSGARDNAASKILETQESGSDGEDGIDSYLLSNKKISVNTSVDESTEDNLHHSHVSRSENFPPPPSLCCKNTSENKGDGRDFIEDSILPRVFRPISPTLEVSTKCLKRSPINISTSARPYSSPLSSSSPNTSDSPSRIKENFKMMRDSFEKPVTQDNSKTIPKPPTKPKPKRNNIVPPQTVPSTPSHDKKGGIYSTRDNFKLISAPKPYGSQSTSFGATSKGSVNQLSHSVNSKTYLKPHAVSGKRTHPKNGKLISSNDSAEHAVFV